MPTAPIGISTPPLIYRCFFVSYYSSFLKLTDINIIPTITNNNPPTPNPFIILSINVAKPAKSNPFPPY